MLLIAALAAPGTHVIRGVVRGPDDQPVAQADIWLFESGSPVPPEEREAMHSTTDQEGRFALPLRADAQYGWNYQINVLACKPGAGIAVTDVDARFPPVQTLAIKLRASAPTKMRVVDPSGAAVQNASVSVSDMTDRSDSGILMLPNYPLAQFRGRTDSRGEVTLELFRPLNWFTLTVETPEFGVQTLSAHGSFADSPVSLAAPGKVRGRLVADDPKLLAGVSVRVESELKLQDRVRFRRSIKAQADVRTDEDGRFEVAALAPGDVRVVRVERAAEPLVFQEADVNGKLQSGGILDLEVPVVGGVRVFGTVIQEANGEGLAAMRVHVSIDDGRYVGFSRSVMTDHEGGYDVIMSPGPGRCSVQVGPLPQPWLPANTDRLRGRIPTAGNQLEMPSFVVKRGINLTGTVLDADARPVPTAHVQAATVDATRKHFHRVLVETDAKGSFSIGPMDPDLVVALMASDDLRATGTVLTAEPGAARTGIVLRTEAAAMAEVSGRLIDTDGRPVAHECIAIDPGMDSGEWECDAMKALRPISSQWVMSDAQGRYVIPNRLPVLGRYWIHIMSRTGHARKRLLLDGSGLIPGQQSLEDVVLEREK
jgi:uncharacterized GH25 family protein